MYAVRNSSGKVVARFKTRAQAEACVRRTAKSSSGARLRSNSKVYIELRRRAFERLIAPPPPPGAFGDGYGLTREQAEKLLATRYAARVLAIVGLTIDEKVAKIAEQTSWTGRGRVALSPDNDSLFSQIRAHGRIRFEDRRKRADDRAREGMRWTAYVSAFGYDAAGQGSTKLDAARDAVRQLPAQYARHFQG